MQFRPNRFVVVFAGVLALAVSARPDVPAMRVSRAAEPFLLADVRLLDGPFRDAMLRDQQYLLSLDADRLLRNFRVNVGLPTDARPLGGWEAPNCELRGHSVGHYLSAVSLMYASTGDERFKQRADYMVGVTRAVPEQFAGGGFSRRLFIGVSRIVH